MENSHIQWTDHTFNPCARREQEFRATVNPAATIFRKDSEPITMHELAALFEAGYTPRTAQESCGGRCMLPSRDDLNSQPSAE